MQSHPQLFIRHFFASRYQAEDKLSEIRGYIEQDRTHFSPQCRSTLVLFLQHVDMVITDVANAQDTKELPAISIRMFLSIYSYWTEHNLLPKDSLADNRLTLLDNADAWLAKGASTPK